LNRADLHAAAAACAEVVIDIERVLDDDDSVPVRSRLDGLDPGVGESRHPGVTGDPQVQGSELVLEVFGPFRETFAAAGKFEEVGGLRDPDEEMAGLGQILRHFQGPITGADKQDGLLHITG
jgi:hypothetical protein